MLSVIAFPDVATSTAILPRRHATTHFSRAAEVGRVARRSRSQQIIRRANTLGERLFECTPREVTLNSAIHAGTGTFTGGEACRWARIVHHAGP
jgi:polynucleotide 5'-kinase involved in rRNA processing